MLSHTAWKKHLFYDSSHFYFFLSLWKNIVDYVNLEQNIKRCQAKHCIYLQHNVSSCYIWELPRDPWSLPLQHEGEAACDIHAEGRWVEVCTVILQQVAKTSQAGTDGEAELQQEAEEEVMLSLQTLPRRPVLCGEDNSNTLLALAELQLQKRQITSCTTIQLGCYLK